MSRTILVPLDGSPLAERALPYALRVARAGAGRVSLVRATLAPTLPGVDAATAQARATQRAEDDLAAVAARVRAEGVPVDTCVYYAEPADAIRRAAEAEHASLIVMSTHGRSGVGRWIYGSVADEVLRATTVPVLLVPSIGDRAWPADGASLRVLVPLDGFELAEQALDPAGELAGRAGVTLVLLRAVEPVLPVAADGLYYVQPFDETAALAAAQAELEQVAARLRDQGWTVEARTVLGYPASSIAAVAAEAAVDAIAMATHAREGVARLVLGSVATGVLQRSHVPVLLVRSRAVQPAAAAGAVEARGVTVTLTPRELQLVQLGLDELLRGAEIEAGRRVRDAEGAILARTLARRLAAEGERTASPPSPPRRPAEMIIV